MKSTVTKVMTDSDTITRTSFQNIALTDEPGRYDLIAKSAYYKAEERGFMPGHEIEDWLTAENEISSAGEKS